MSIKQDNFSQSYLERYWLKRRPTPTANICNVKFDSKQGIDHAPLFTTCFNYKFEVDIETISYQY